VDSWAERASQPILCRGPERLKSCGMRSARFGPRASGRSACWAGRPLGALRTVPPHGGGPASSYTNRCCRFRMTPAAPV